MILIWGTKGIAKTLEEGTIQCPICNIVTHYELKEIQKYFTFFWIPLFPFGKKASYLECQTCETAFNPHAFV